MDHICISKKVRRRTQDVRVKRGADCASDHHLVTARVKLRLKKQVTEPGVVRRKFNVGLLRDMNTQQQYSISLTNRFHVLSELWDDDTDMHTQWCQVKEAVTETC